MDNNQNNQNNQYDYQGQQNYNATPQQPQNNYQAAPGPEGKVPMEKKEFGIISLVLGCIGIIMMCCNGIGLLFGIPAIILGKMALNANEGRDNVDGLGLAKAGFIIGIIVTAISALTLIAFIVMMVTGMSMDYVDYMNY